MPVLFQLRLRFELIAPEVGMIFVILRLRFRELACIFICRTETLCRSRLSEAGLYSRSLSETC